MASVFSVSALQYARDSSYYAAPNTNTGSGNNFGVIGVQYAKDLPYFTPNVVANSGAGANFSASALAYGENASYYALSALAGTAPSGPPGIPTFLSSTPTSLTFQTDSAGVTGTPTPQFLMDLEIDGSPPFVSQLAVLSSGTLWQTTFTGLSAGSLYRCQAIASNGISPNQPSGVSSAYSPS